MTFDRSIAEAQARLMLADRCSDLRISQTTGLLMVQVTSLREQRRIADLTDGDEVRIIITMKNHGSLTALLRESLDGCESVRAVGRATGLAHESLLRFRRGDTSLRLDLADRLAEYFEIESRRLRRRKG